MEDKTQKERLEQELRFLKESFEAEVISKEEFEKGRDRIERKLREIQGKNIEEMNTEEPKKDAAIESKEAEKIKLKVIQDETEEHKHFEPLQLKADNAERAEQTASEEPEKDSFKKQKKESKFFRYAAVFIFLILVAYFSYSLLKNKPDIEKNAKVMNFVAACDSNQDCNQEGIQGFCLDSGTKDAKCEFKEIEKTNVVILNDRKDCFNCDTQRVLAILEGWFGALNVKEIDYNTLEGKNLADRLDAKILPVYVLDENISKNPQFEQLRAVFIKKNNNYVLSGDAAASAFYFKRDNIPNKLDLFVILGESTSIKAENNLKEFLESFKDAKFEKHAQDDKTTKELGIKNFPAFLVNNRIKFTGVQSAETIKENFCKMNKLTGCNISLSRNLV